MDDLTKITGVGEATAKTLVELGINTYAALATADPAQLRKDGKFRPAQKVEDWIAEANSISSAPNGDATNRDGANGGATSRVASPPPGENEPQGTNTQGGSGTAREASGGQPLPGDGDIGGLKQGTQSAPQTQLAQDALELTVITVKGPARGRWRAGMHFGPEPRTVEVTADQLEAIDKDSALTWTPAETAD